MADRLLGFSCTEIMRAAYYNAETHTREYTGDSNLIRTL